MDSEYAGYVIAVEAGGLAALLCAAVWSLFFRFPTRARRLYRKAARGVRGRLDPASERARYPAVLAEIDGHLLRAAAWPVPDAAGAGAPHPPYLEICVPVDGVGATASACRGADRARILALLGDRSLDPRDVPEAAWMAGCGAREASTWAARALARHSSWAAIQLDVACLRVLTDHPQRASFGAAMIADAMVELAAALPAIGREAGVAGLESSARRPHGPAIY